MSGEQIGALVKLEGEMREVRAKLDVARAALERIATEQFATSGKMRDIAAQGLGNSK